MKSNSENNFEYSGRESNVSRAANSQNREERAEQEKDMGTGQGKSDSGTAKMSKNPVGNLPKKRKEGQKKGRIFDFGLYREAILQLRPFAVISVILLLGNVLVCFAWEMINYLDAQDTMVVANASGQLEAVTYTATADYYQFQFMAFVFMLVMVPIMTLYLFSFLNKRNLSDFYHSIPHTRICLSFSFLLAIVTYIVIIVGVCGMLGAASFRLLPCEVEFYDVGVAAPIFNVICGSIFMMSVFWLAMSLTGTIFMNIAAAALIFAIPTCVLFYTGAVICGFVPYIPYEGLPGIFNGSCNVITGMFSYLVFWSSGADYDNIFGTASTGVCTLLTALVLLVLGFVFFRFRKSEYAESASIHPVVQSVFRIGAGFLVSMFVTGSVLMEIVDDGTEYIDTEYIFWWCVFYAIAIFVYYLFELVTTRQPRRLLHIWKGLLVVVLANVVWAGVEYGISMQQMNWCPDADEIISVELSDQNGYYTADWWQAKISNVTLDSDDMIALVSEALDNTIDLWKAYREDPDAYWALYENDDRIVSDTYYYNMSATVTFQIHTKTGTTARTVRMTKEQYDRFVTYLASEEDGFAENYTEMPDFTKVEFLECSLFYSNYYESDMAAEETGSLTYEQWKEIYDTWCAEAKTTDFTRLFYLTYEEGGYENEYLNVTFRDISGQYYYACLPLTADFPETLTLIAGYIAENYAELLGQGVVSEENILREMMNSGSDIYNAYMCLIQPDDTEISGYQTTYCWEMIDEWVYYYLDELYADYYGDSGSDDGTNGEEESSSADPDATEGDAEEETSTAEDGAGSGTSSTAAETGSGTSSTKAETGGITSSTAAGDTNAEDETTLSDPEEDDQAEAADSEILAADTLEDTETVKVLDSYTYQDFLKQWERLADELDNCMELEFTAGAPILIIYADVEYYNEDGEYEYADISYVTVVTDAFVELFEEYLEMADAQQATYGYY